MRPPLRRFGLLDAMLLVLAVSVGMAVSVAIFQEMSRPEFIWRKAKPLSTFAPGYRVLFIRDTISLVTPCVGTLSLMLTGLALVRPRPPLRRVWRAPGTAGCLAASFAIVILACSLIC
ncbi:MAG: hypothetical protein U0835_20740 [Isosphaeraceae bacterium]